MMQFLKMVLFSFLVSGAFLLICALLMMVNTRGGPR